MDKKDKKLLAELMVNSRIPINKLAKKGDVIPVPRKIPEISRPLGYLYPLKLLKESSLKVTLFRNPAGGYRVGSHLRKTKTSLPYKIKHL